MRKKIKPIDGEPIFGIHIDFGDGSNPIEYFNLDLKRAATVLQEWGEEWILVPKEKCLLGSSVWYWEATKRRIDKLVPKKVEPEDDDEPDYIEIEED